MKTIIYLFLLLSLCSCELMEYSPNQVFDKNTPRDLNKKNIARLLSAPADDTIRFVLTGDSQRAYKNAEDFVQVVNKIAGIDFVFLAGDISDFGLLGEMEWVDEIFSKLKTPYIGVVGNHDLVANGEKVYTRMYGPKDFGFTYQGVKFVCHNTNSRETNFDGNVPNISWLKNELLPSEGVEAYVTVAHVPPFSGDFDQNLQREYVKTVNSCSALAALYAHNHKEEIRYENNIPFMVTNAIIKRQFLLVEIVNGKLNYESVEY
ncbi:metallophosphoesterase family protein [Paradesertivirga mongoliensis]|uniref:Metallophosphoesterase family protein n=1 Tax=Paradesertivirga mongoliensis TaxID=2100740 RepID=A0ABW4ZIJ3_9SPHI|nr:metallophosphoesterase [Pedobacter mongoliensis]